MTVRGYLPLVALLLALTACGTDQNAADTEVTVLAAASLTESFTTLADSYESAHDAQVVTTFGSSTDLAEQVADGAPGDVLATADETSMQIAVDAGSVEGDPVRFASNHLVIVTAPGNPRGVTSLDDLADVTWVRCDDAVPCGRVAITLLDEGGVTAFPASLEVDVKSTLEKVVSGEADAALVYASDAVAAGDDVAVVEIPGAERAANDYFIAVAADAADPEAARAFVDLVTGDEGRQALTDAGFVVP